MKTWLFIVALLLLVYGIFEPSIRKDTSNKRWLVFLTLLQTKCQKYFYIKIIICIFASWKTKRN